MYVSAHDIIANNIMNRIALLVSTHRSEIKNGKHKKVTRYLPITNKR